MCQCTFNSSKECTKMQNDEMIWQQTCEPIQDDYETGEELEEEEIFEEEDLENEGEKEKEKSKTFHEKYTDQELDKHLFNCYIHGIGIQKYFDILTYAGVKVPSVDTLNKRQAALGPSLEEFCLNRIQKYITDDMKAAYDCAWTGRRNAFSSFSSLTNIVLNKICGFSSIC